MSSLIRSSKEDDQHKTLQCLDVAAAVHLIDNTAPTLLVASLAVLSRRGNHPADDLADTSVFSATSIGHPRKQVLDDRFEYGRFGTIRSDL